MHKRKLLLGLMLGAVASASAQSLLTWPKYKTIAINTKASGANVAGTVKNIPVLVRLNAANANDIFTEAAAGGADIRFGNAAGVARPFEIESWDATAKTAAIWVLADSVKGNDSIAALRIYWGRAGSTAASNGAAVFDTANGYRAVYHMNGKTSVTENDATLNAVHMSASDSVAGAVPGDTVGMIGGARVFAGNAATVEGRQYFVAANTAANPQIDAATSSPHTISAWVFARAISATNSHGNSIFNKGDKQFAMQIYGATGATAKLWESAIYTSTWRQAKSKGVASTGAWFHITGTWSGSADSTAKLYVNGVQDTSLAVGLGTVNPERTYNLFIGANPSAGSATTAPGTPRSLATGTSANPRFWNGYIDEVTLSRRVRSADFVKLTYETQKAAAAAVVLGATETQTFTPTAVTDIYYQMQGAGNAPRDTLVFTYGVPVNLTLKYTGGPADSIKITTGALPAGLSIDKFSGAITGTPTAVTGAGNQTLTVYASLGNVTRGLRISVLPGALSLVKYTNDTATYTAGVPVVNSPQLSPNGRTATKFRVTPALPAGLVLDSVTGIISGAPTAAAAAANFTVSAMNATDTSSRNLRFTVQGGEDYSTWTRNRTYYLNTSNTSNGPKISANVRNFPVAIRIAGTDSIFRQVLAGAADLRFTKANNTTFLPYEIEQWDSAKAAVIWVLVDTIKTNSSDQSIRMHWGKTGVNSLSNGSTVFSVANGFQAVWHMNGAAGANETDVTSNGFVAVAQANPGDSTGGAVGKARKFDGATQFFQVANSVTGALDFGLDQNYTLSAWANPKEIPQNDNGMKLVEKGDDQWTLAVYNGSNPKYWEITTKLNNGGQTWAQATSEAAGVTAESGVNKWNHIVGTYTGAALNGTMAESLWVNGAFMGVRNEVIASLTTSRTTTRPVNIGVQGTAALPGGTYTRYWNGMLDEVRLSNVARSKDWVALEYANQQSASAQTFVLTTPPTSLKGQLSASAIAQGFSVKTAGQGMTFQMPAAHDGKAVMSLVDMWGRTVWTGAFAPGATQLSWNGTVRGGAANTGVYVARLTLLNNAGKMVQVFDRKVPYTR